jgi:hypothetical protein
MDGLFLYLIVCFYLLIRGEWVSLKEHVVLRECVYGYICAPWSKIVFHEDGYKIKVRIYVQTYFQMPSIATSTLFVSTDDQSNSRVVYGSDRPACQVQQTPNQLDQLHSCVRMRKRCYRVSSRKMWCEEASRFKLVSAVCTEHLFPVSKQGLKTKNWKTSNALLLHASSEMEIK